MVIVLVPMVKLKLGSSPDVVVVVPEPVVSVGVDVGVVVVVVDDGAVVVDVVAVVRDVEVLDGAGPVLPPLSNISNRISTNRSRMMAPNNTNAHGLRYQGLGGFSGGPGGGPPGGCWPYPGYWAGWSE